MTLNLTTVPGINPARSIRSKVFDVLLVANQAARTLTVSDVLKGQFTAAHDAGLDMNTVLTLPTAAEFLADPALNGASEGDSFPIVLRNGDGNNTLELAVPVGGGVTLDGVGIYTVPANNTRNYKLKVHNVTPGSEALIVYDVSSGANE